MNPFTSLRFAQWFGTGFLLFILAGLHAGNVCKPAVELTIAPSRPLTWTFDGTEHSLSLLFRKSDYGYYKALPKATFKANDYAKYAGEDPDHMYLLQLAQKLDCKKYSGNQLAQYLVAFVQQAIPYTSDPKNREYPRYPIETLVDGGGDCEDKAALLVALLKVFGFDAVMVDLADEHMAAAVWSEDTTGWHYTVNPGKKNYAFIETTNPGWDIGEMDPKLRKIAATIVITPGVPKYQRNQSIAGTVAIVKAPEHGTKVQTASFPQDTPVQSRNASPAEETTVMVRSGICIVTVAKRRSVPAGN